MSCDIHMYVEYRRYGDDQWWNWGAGIHPPNNDYELFGALADVQGPGPAKYPRRGMPSNAGLSTVGANSIYVSDEGNKRYCPRATAEKWVREGLATWTDSSKNWVTNPDWHSHSYLSLEEFEEVANPIIDREDNYAWEYRALRAAMRQLHDDGCEVRVVFWFDN